MPLLRSLLMRAALRIASDPRVQAKAAEVYDGEVKPRAEAAWSRAKPKLAAAKAELREVAREADPRGRARELARKLKRRLDEGTGPKDR